MTDDLMTRLQESIPPTPKGRLRAALKELERRGWVQFRLVQLYEYDESVGEDVLIGLEDCRVCSLGAVRAAWGHPVEAPRDDRSAYEDVILLLAQTIEPDFADHHQRREAYDDGELNDWATDVVINFNDHDGRTYAEVRAVFAEAAGLEE